MNITFKALWIGSLVGATLLVTQAVRADDWNKKTTVTFSGPIEIPGVHLQGWGVLPAGDRDTGGEHVAHSMTKSAAKQDFAYPGRQRRTGAARD